MVFFSKKNGWNKNSRWTLSSLVVVHFSLMFCEKHPTKAPVFSHLTPAIVHRHLSHLRRDRKCNWKSQKISQKTSEPLDKQPVITVDGKGRRDRKLKMGEILFGEMGVPYRFT